MAAPFLYVALGLGKAIYKIANTPAGKEALKKFMSKKNPYGIKQIKPSDLPKNIQDGTKVPNTLTQSILKQKDPGIATKVANVFSRRKNRVTKKTEGVEKPGTGAEPVGKLRTKQKKKGRTIITAGITAPTSAAITYASSKSRKKDKPKRKPSAELLDRKNINTARPKPKPKPRVKKKDYSPPGKGLKRITVQKGDMLETIAKREGTTVDRIMTLNPNIKNRDRIKTGQKIIVRGN